MPPRAKWFKIIDLLMRAAGRAAQRPRLSAADGRQQQEEPCWVSGIQAFFGNMEALRMNEGGEPHAWEWPQGQGPCREGAAKKSKG